MYAIINTGGKQLRVEQGKTIFVEKIEGEVGSKIQLTKILMVKDDAGLRIGTPFVEGYAIEAEIIDQVKADKVIIFKKNRRHNYRRKNGHRQRLTALHIGEFGVSPVNDVVAVANKAPARKKKTEVAGE